MEKIKVFLPKRLGKEEFQKCLSLLDKIKHKELLEAYKKTNDYYELKKGYGGIEVIAEVASHIPNCQDNIKEAYGNYAKTSIVAQYFYDYSKRCKRINDSKMDWIKAEYLLRMIGYLKIKDGYKIEIKVGPEMDEMIIKVNTILDSAYFTKINNPWKSDQECFFEAERECCKEKFIDYLLTINQGQLYDYKNAITDYKNHCISSIAEKFYRQRLKEGTDGDCLDDWLKAESHFPKWEITKRIATICWNLSKKKDQDQDTYWHEACRIVNILDKNKIDYTHSNIYNNDIYIKISDNIKV